MAHTDTPRYPNCNVRLIGRDGNAFVMLAAVRSALKKHLRHDLGLTIEDTKAEVEAFTLEATSGNYDGLLTTCCRWVEVS